MSEWNWLRIGIGALLVLGGGAGVLVLEGTALGWPVVVLGCIAIFLGIRPTFSPRDAAWALLLVLGMGLVVVGLGGWPVIADVDLSGLAFVAGMAIILVDSILVARERV
jgi:hypothetical protein